MSKRKISIPPAEQIPPEVKKNEKPVCLKNDSIFFVKPPLRKRRSNVPPPTPSLNIECTRVKEPPEIDVRKIEEVPKVKDEGIKFTIENLGRQLGLGYYEYDLIQFWLLDMLTDCVWKAQEVFQFGAEEQKMVLNWITALFKIIADPILNISRRDFLKLFKEVLLESYKKISNRLDFPGTDLLNEAAKKYVAKEHDHEEVDDDEEENEDENEESDSSSSSRIPSLSTLSIQNDDHIVIYPEFNIKEHISRLKKDNPLGNAYHCYSEANPPSTKVDETETVEGEDLACDYRDLLLEQVGSFYKPDIGTPERFRSSPDIEISHQPPYICECTDPEENSSDLKQAEEAKMNKPNRLRTGTNEAVKQEEEAEMNKSSIATPDTYRTSVEKQPQCECSEDNSYDVAIKEGIIEEDELTLGTKSSSNRLEESPSANVRNMSASSQIINYLAKSKYEQIFPKPCMKGVRMIKIPEPEETEKLIMSEEELEKIKERELLNEWAYFLMMEKRGWDMNDPNVGWVPWLSFLANERDCLEANASDIKQSLEEFTKAEVEVRHSETSHEEFERFEDRSRNFTMLRAIVDFVFEYFYENFHFTLIKLAFRSTPNTITQELNSKWLTPKVIKQEFKRPKPMKKKKEKKAKKKKDKKKSKKSKSSKDKKKKKTKKDKKAKKPKAPKLTKEEKARLKKLAELEEEQRRIREENRVFMFPLADAASEDLFMNIFENWVKKAAKDKKGKKGKKGGKKKKK